MNLRVSIITPILLSLVIGLAGPSCTKKRRAEAQVRSSAKAVVEDGWQELRAKKYNAATQKFRQAITFDPRYASPYYGMGVALKEQGKWEEAIPYIEKFIGLDSQPYSVAYSDLGLARMNTGKFPEAKMALDKALRVDSNNAQAYFALAQYYAVVKGKKRDFQQAYYQMTQAEARGIKIPHQLRNRISAGIAGKIPAEG